VLRLLLERRHDVRVYDPLAREFDEVLAPTVEDAMRGADATILITDHRVFLEIDPHAVAPVVRRKILIDTRAFLNRDAWIAAGFAVRTLGVAQAIRELEAFGSNA
jgi:UDPglucose 6-dehydrogenase